MFVSATSPVAASHSDTLGVHRNLEALRIQAEIKIDGILGEPEWLLAQPATGFVQYEQFNGRQASQRTEVRVVYDESALYIGAQLYDTSPDSIYRELGGRDNGERLKSDAFSVYISTYNDGVNYLKFMVSASGVQTDLKLTADVQERAWNAVWESEVTFSSLGWCVEMKIPYSALRFSAAENSLWGINFERVIKRHNERSTWNYVNNAKQGFTIQSGVLAGIQGIAPPLRLSFTPYISAYANRQPRRSGMEYRLNGGMDFKMGLNESFTLDMTLIPDFGQVKSDDRVLNITPFEVQYDENRQFFTEGTELYNKAGVFYSRRIGSKPVDYSRAYASINANEVVWSNPSETKMINATKISGRTSGGTGLGFFNAMTQKAEAEIRDTLTGALRNVQTQPFTNYNILVLDQSLPHSSYVNIINTNMFRTGYCANVSATDFLLRNRNNSFMVEGKGALSQQISDSALRGYSSFIALHKSSGSIRANVWANVESQHYNPNDMGYQQQANRVVSGYEMSYQLLAPRWRLISFRAALSYDYGMLYKPNVYTSQNIRAEARFTNLRHYTASASIRYTPFTNYDYYEPRTLGYRLNRPSKVYAQWFGSPDYRRWLAVDHIVALWKTADYNHINQSGYNYMIRPRIRFNDRMLLIVSWNSERDFNSVGYFTKTDYAIIMAKRNIVTRVSTVNFQYTINSKSFISVLARHYNRSLQFNHFYTLEQSGDITPTTWSDHPGISYNAFNLDLTYQWNFAPGSELVVVWKNSTESNSTQLIDGYRNNVQAMGVEPMFSGISFKILYYIDYFKLRKCCG